MRLVHLALATLLALLGAQPLPAQQPARAEHVILISIDGLRPEFYLDPSWPAPTIQQMARQGAYAQAVRGVFPTVTYPSHTTLVTGALPARHGILYNTPFEENGQTGRWYWDAKQIRVATLWDAVRAAGGTTASIGWPVSVGAPIDFNVPEVWSPSGTPSWPEVIRTHATPAGLIDELEREATGRLPVDAFEPEYMVRDDYAGAMAAHLFTRYRPRLMTIHLTSADAQQHNAGRDGPGVRRAVAAVDRAVSRLLEAVERAGAAEKTAFVIAGDHGFVDIHTQVAPNVWLAQAGLVAPRPDRGNWRATFHASSGSAFLYLRKPSDMAALRQVRQLLDALPPGQRRLFRVLERAELDRVGAAPGAALALAAVRGVTFVDPADGPALRPGSGGTHGFFPDLADVHTGFLAWGAGIRAGTVVPTLGLEDVAPAIAALLGVDLQAPDGMLVQGLIRP